MPIQIISPIFKLGYFSFNFWTVTCVLVAQSCPTLCEPMNYSPSGSSYSEDLPNPGIECTQVSHIAGGFFTIWVTREAWPFPNLLTLVLMPHPHFLGLPWWLWLLGLYLKCRKSRFNSWVGKLPWRKAWQPTPAFLPGQSHGQRSLRGYSPWGRKESDRRLTHTQSFSECYQCSFNNMSLTMSFPCLKFFCEYSIHAFKIKGPAVQSPSRHILLQFSQFQLWGFIF